MKKFVLSVVIVLLAFTAVVSQAQETYAEIDQEMIGLLALNAEQASAYQAIMQTQRAALLAINTQEWHQQLALYQETYDMLKPVLTAKQHAEFVAIINSVIEDTGEDDFVAMRD